jgi:hypothetical protein
MSGSVFGGEKLGKLHACAVVEKLAISIWGPGAMFCMTLCLVARIFFAYFYRMINLALIEGIVSQDEPVDLQTKKHYYLNESKSLAFS